MTLTINGQPADHAAATLAELVEALGLADAKVATALNGTFVPVRTRAATPLSHGDRIEVVAPRQGG
ncbi:sulfur carrier protein ThiS [Lichenihabitans sp. Uapishka_5]|uniref:sulfur carrier protein ThiS n=1 Tax=Lichenihabitans sp. Uapishka_5 TaxID=3037302 RepID=UPI0029E7EF11|nr:sulfur carrier protein ThiS [Lichenihabitans sp. Uapishka_5]MDX7953001.1 sulfur carrier protein ThiS [Lichenihabitans sp. Uapishka_5]